MSRFTAESACLTRSLGRKRRGEKTRVTKMPPTATVLKVAAPPLPRGWEDRPDRAHVCVYGAD
jgi:hypothetical protein